MKNYLRFFNGNGLRCYFATDPNGNGIDPNGDGNDPNSGGGSGRTYTDEDVDRIINTKFAAWQKKQADAVQQAVKAAEDKWKLSEEDRKAQENADLLKELAALRSEKKRNEILTSARDYFKQQKISISDDVLKTLITDDEDSSLSAVKSFAVAYTKEIECGVKNALKGSMPRKHGSGEGGAMTKEDILKIKSTKDRLKAIEENFELFRKEKQ